MTTFKLGDAEYRLELTMREAMEYERQTGRSFFADAQALASQPTAAVTIGLLWAAMLKHAPSLTLDEVASHVKLGDLPQVAEALRKAYEVPFVQGAGAGAEQQQESQSP